MPANISDCDIVTIGSHIVCCGDNRLFTHVLRDDVLWFGDPNDAVHLRPKINGNTPTSRRGAERLTREPACNDIKAAPIKNCEITMREMPDIVNAFDIRPVLGKYRPLERLNLAKRHRLEAASALEAKIDSAYTGEDGEHPQRDRKPSSRSRWELGDADAVKRLLGGS